MKKTERNYSKLIKDSSEKGLSDSEKRKMFFFGFFIILITGTRVFYHLSGNKELKRQTLIYYFSSLIFWISMILLTLFIIDKFNI